jgi:hypothetical protein
MEASAILQPVLVMAALTTVMNWWMIGSRVPKMSKLGIDPQQAQDTARLIDLLPRESVRISNNYNHLFEQPTLFYAVAISIAVLGHVDAVYVGCAWAYTGLRIAHSLWQALVDIVPVRFTLYALSWIVLTVMVVRELVMLF